MNVRYVVIQNSSIFFRYVCQIRAKLIKARLDLSTINKIIQRPRPALSIFHTRYLDVWLLALSQTHSLKSLNCCADNTEEMSRTISWTFIHPDVISANYFRVTLKNKALYIYSYCHEPSSNIFSKMFIKSVPPSNQRTAHTIIRYEIHQTCDYEKLKQ